MRFFTITDDTDDGKFLAFDLIDILTLFPEKVEESSWDVSDVECSCGDAILEFDEMSDSEERTDGMILLRVAANVQQTIEGTFSGFRPEQNFPWIIITAVDSSAFDVQCNDSDVITRIMKRFAKVKEII